MPALDDDFSGPALDAGRWIAQYLPEWTTPDRAAARYALGPDGLRLLIEADQPAWRPEDGELRVSSVQTGTGSGPLGSDRGMSRDRPDRRVRTPQAERRLWTPSAGRVEATVAASPDPACMTAVWLPGLEAASPDDSGEVCVCELFGDRIGPAGSTVRTGVKALNDPRLHDDVVDVELPIDATRPHTYAAEWGADGVRVLVDGAVVHTSAQVLAYPLVLLVSLFEFPASPARDPAAYPKAATVRSVRAGTPVNGVPTGS